MPRGCEMPSRIIHYGMHVELAADAASIPCATQYAVRSTCSGALACARARAPGSGAPSKSPLSEKTNSGRCAMRPSAGLTGGLGVPCCAVPLREAIRLSGPPGGAQAVRVAQSRTRSSKTWQLLQGGSAAWWTLPVELALEEWQ